MRSSITVMAVALALAMAGNADAFFGSNSAGYGGSGGWGASWGNDCDCANAYAGYGDYTNCRYAADLWAGFCAPGGRHCSSGGGCGLAGLAACQGCCGAGGGWWYGGNQQPCAIPRLAVPSGFSGLGCLGGLGGGCGPATRGCGPATGCAAGGGGGLMGCGGFGGFESLFQRLRSQMACRSWIGGGPLDRYGVSDGFGCSDLDLGIFSKWGSAPAEAEKVPLGPVDSYDEEGAWEHTQGESPHERNSLDNGLDLEGQ